MLSKLHKSKKINENIAIKRTKYIKIGEGQLNKASLVFQTSGISKTFQRILKQALFLI